MRTSISKSKRSSRWTRDPIIKGDRAVGVSLTERDVEIFKLLIDYRYLPSDYIHAFVGGSASALGRRLNLLSRKPNLYLARPFQQRLTAAANYRHMIYELDERGSRVLKERGLLFLPNSYHRNFAHELMVSQVMASIDLGTRERKNVRLITWPEILANSSTPEVTRKSPTAASIPVTFTAFDQRHSMNINADARPFGIERVIGGSRTFLFFPGVEADCGTEPIGTNDFERSSISKKLAAYIAITQQGVHRAHFGFPNFFIPFITTTTSRMASIMALLSSITGGKGAKTILFKTFPSLTSFEKPAPPTGHMLTEPWQRVGFGPFGLAD